MTAAVVYTCIAGDYDRLQAQPRFAGIRYVCFTDDRALLARGNHLGWEIRPAEVQGDIVSPHLVNRYCKMLGYRSMPDATATVYIDGNVVLRTNPARLVEATLDSGHPIGAFRHPERATVAQEFDACFEDMKVPADRADGVLAYREEQKRAGFDDQLGLSTNYLLVRSVDTAGLDQIMQDWWADVSEKSYRDQLALQYVLWRHDRGWFALDDVVPRKHALYHARHGHPNRIQRGLDAVRRAVGIKVAG